MPAHKKGDHMPAVKTEFPDFYGLVITGDVSPSLLKKIADGTGFSIYDFDGELRLATNLPRLSDEEKTLRRSVESLAQKHGFIFIDLIGKKYASSN
jgi:hypothetical protein